MSPVKKRKSKAKTPEVLPPIDARQNLPEPELLPELLEEENQDENKDPEVLAEPSDSQSSENQKLIQIDSSSLGALSASEPLRRYLEELRRYPLLEPEEELKLVKKMQEEGDVLAAKTLVQANLRLVVKIALEYKSIYSNLLDLIQEGNMGLMRAVSKYDPTKGARLGYYASWWIRSYILKYLLDNFRLVRIGTTQAQKKLFYHLMREKERLEAQGLLAGPKLLAQKLDVREKDIEEMQLRLSSQGAELPLDAPIDPGAEKKVSHIDLLVDQNPAIDEELALEQGLDVLKKNLPQFEKNLNEREKIILKERLLAEEPKTLQEVADLYGLTRERVRQIEVEIIKKLREKLKKALK